jgi:bifunctional NMN adenylyltransferase/nudix hydrolase
MASKFQLAVYIGRFQPLHLGHTHVIDEALKKYDGLVILIGSANQARDIKNPFVYEERKSMIEAYLAYANTAKPVWIKPLVNQVYNNPKWQQSVQELVYSVLPNPQDVEVTITGSDRDDTTWYVHAFPQWKKDLKPAVPEGQDLSATKLRKALFTNEVPIGQVGSIENDIPPTTLRFLDNFAKTTYFVGLKDEFTFNEKYRSQFGRGEINKLIARYEEFEEDGPGFDIVGIKEDLKALRETISPYPPMFVTTDVVVIQSGHVLVVERGALPGKGLWALPGGFLASRLKLRDNAIKELIEETGIRLTTGKRWKEVTEEILTRSIIGKEVFDDPDRSLRGRTVTVAYLIHLDDTKPLPLVHGMNAPLEETGGKIEVETANAMWIPIAQARANRHRWFEDHPDILDTMLGMIKE